MNTAFKDFVQDELEQVTVKIATSANISEGFQGTGFFITNDGYILTAWHCIKDAITFKEDIFIECDGDSFLAQVDEDKSLEGLDIAVLKINHQKKHCIPLGTISEQHENQEVVSVGYPGIDKINTGIGCFDGEIPRFIDTDDIEIHNAILGKGQSGGLVYHYETHRIVGVVKNIIDTDILRNLGSAVRFDCLFKKWPELIDINKEIAKVWKNRLRRKKLSKPQQPPLSDSFLWYFINRLAQRIKLDSAIAQHLADTNYKKCPLLCLVHGDECEYDPFLDWLKYVISHSFPKCNTPMMIPIKTEKIRQITDLHNYVLHGLKNKLLGEEQAFEIAGKTLEEKIAERMAMIKNSPIVVPVSLHTEDGQSLGKKLIEDGFIKFWAKWQPHHQQNQPLLVFLLFKYQTEKKSLLKRLFSVNKKLEHFFDNLDKLDKLNFAKKFSINGFVLPKLDRIRKHEVIDWINDYYEEYFSQFCSDKPSLINDIDDLYEQHPNGISMRKLVPKLKKLMQSAE